MDDAEHVGVLEQQRPRADAVERVPEAPDLVAVRVGDGADRARGEVAGRVADAERRAGAQRLDRERAERARRARRARVRPRLAAAALERAAERRGEPGDGQRRGHRAGAREGARAPARACGASTGLPRIASIGVASTTLPPYSPTDSETAPMLRATPAASGQ